MLPYYAIIISVYNPPSIVNQTIKKLLSTKEIAIYVIDSSASKDVNEIYPIQHTNFHYFNVPNLGQPYKLNFGIEQCLKRGYEFVTIFTDDTALETNSFPIQEIKKYFYQNCNPSRDVLILPSDVRMIEKRTVKRSVDSGMTFHKNMLTNIKFREDLVIDQFDLLFCDSVYDSGGKIIVYPDILISVLPIGREGGGKFHSLPIWRLYLLTRNTFYISLHLHKSRLKSLLLNTAPQILSWSIKGLITNFSLKRNPFSVLRALMLGLDDAINKRLGITDNLQKLSGNRFNQINSKISKSVRGLRVYDNKEEK
jgi:hypothetical protein